MSTDGKPRRAFTLLKVGRGQPARPMVEKRPLFNYWAILMPHFRGVLLPPQNRSDESIQWTWTEPAVAEAISVAELATIRKRLAGAQQSLIDSLEDAEGVAAKTGTMRAVRSQMDEVVHALVALPDSALAGFIARTDRGMLLHSWGLRNPPPVQYLDADLELIGRVLIDGAPASRQEVLLETTDGTVVAKTSTDNEGNFEFSKITTGSYRVRAVSRPPEVLFSREGETVELSGTPAPAIEIRNEDQARKSLPMPAKKKASGRLVRGIVLASVSCLAVAAYLLWPGRGSRLNFAAGNDPSGWDVNVAPRSVVSRDGKNHDESKARSAQTVTQTNSVHQQTLKTPGMLPSSSEARHQPEGTREKDVVVARQSSGLPAQQSGTPAGSIAGIAGGSPGSGTGGPIGGSQAGGHSATKSAGIGAGPSGAGSAAAASAGSSTASPSSAPSRSVASVELANPPPPATKPQGSSPRRDPSPSDSASAVSTELSESTDPTPKSADAPTPAGTKTGVPDEPAPSIAAAETISTAPFAAARVSDADLPDTDMPVPEEASANIEPDRSDEAQSERGEEHGTSIPQENSPGQPNVMTQSSSSALVLRMTLRSSPWQRLLLRDAIVPTLPTPLGRDDAMVDLSTRVLAEKQGSIPGTLQHAHIVTGVRIEFPASFTGASPRWTVLSGAVPLIASADERAAEIGWSEGALSGQYVLLDADGHSIASISMGPESEIRLSSVDDISSWAWVGIECASGEAERFDWQVIGTTSVPSSWTKDHHWRNNRGRRWDLRSFSEKDETTVQSLAIADALTGWAHVSKFEYQQKVRR